MSGWSSLLARPTVYLTLFNLACVLEAAVSKGGISAPAMFLELSALLVQMFDV